MSPKVVEYPSRDALAKSLAELLAERLRALITLNGQARIAVPGGTTPGTMLTHLGEAVLPWDCVTVTLTDERWVPTSSPRSNQRLLSETLFRGAAAAATFVPLYGGTAETFGSLDSVAQGVAQTTLPLDIAVLGMGADMHTASLFPGAVGLEAALAPDAPAVVVIKAAGAEEPRVTLSAQVLRNAGERHILIAGSDKRAALERALAVDDTREAPVRAVLDDATVHYAE